MTEIKIMTDSRGKEREGLPRKDHKRALWGEENDIDFDWGDSLTWV